MLWEPPLGENLWVVVAAVIPIILVIAYVALYLQSMAERRWGKDKDDPPRPEKG